MVPMRNNGNNLMNTSAWLPRFWNSIFDDNWEWLDKTQKMTPAVNVSEDDNAYTVEVAVPGIRKEDCNVRLNDDTLSVTVECKQENSEEQQKNRNFLRKEFSYTGFNQSFALPDNVDRQNIAAKVADGILAITLPKKEVKEDDNNWTDIEVG